MDFSKVILEFRARHKLSQASAADILGISRYMVYLYEIGQNKPSRRNIITFEKIMKEYDENNTNEKE